MGHVANPYSLLAQADLFCLPSLYEGVAKRIVGSNGLSDPGDGKQL